MLLLPKKEKLVEKYQAISIQRDSIIGSGSFIGNVCQQSLHGKQSGSVSYNWWPRLSSQELTQWRTTKSLSKCHSVCQSRVCLEKTIRCPTGIRTTSITKIDCIHSKMNNVQNNIMYWLTSHSLFQNSTCMIF